MILLEKWSFSKEPKKSQNIWATFGKNVAKNFKKSTIWSHWVQCWSVFIMRKQRKELAYNKAYQDHLKINSHVRRSLAHMTSLNTHEGTASDSSTWPNRAPRNIILGQKYLFDRWLKVPVML